MKRFLIKIIFFSFFNLNIFTENNDYNYPAEYYNFAESFNYDTGIVVVGYNRPDYFKQVIDSLAQNQEALFLPFFFILDGGELSTQKEHIDIINESSIKNKFLFIHNYNYGCGRTLIDSRRFMFEWCKFKKIIFFEEDMVVTPNYISLVLKLYAYAKKKYTNVGIVQAYNKCFLSKKITKEKYGNVIFEPFAGFWGYCMDKQTYFAIADLMNEHEKKHLIDIPLGKPNTLAIAKWIEDRELISMHNNYIYNIKSKKKIFSTHINWNQFGQSFVKELKRTPHKRRDGQDWELRLVLSKKNIVRLTTLISRGFYIGAHGIHHNGNHHENYGYNILQLLQNDIPLSIEHFTIKYNFLKDITFDFTYFTGPYDKKIQICIDSFVENGYNVKIVSNEEKLFYGTYYNVAFVKKKFLDKKKYSIYVIPISNGQDIPKTLLNTESNEIFFLYILNKELGFLEECYMSSLKKENIFFIAANIDIKKKLLGIVEKKKLFLWNEVLTVFE